MDFEKRIITDGETIIDKELLEYMEDGIVEAINTADNKVDKSEIYKYTAFGTCDTEAATAEKAIVIDDPNWKLETGNMITVRFSVANKASNVTLNVNNTGAYGIRTSGESAYTGTSSTYCGDTNRSLTFVFDGSYWQWISAGAYPSSATNVSLGQGYTTCSTAASTKAKTASLSSYSLSTGGIVAVKFTNDVPASATLNINSKGAKNIYHKGAAITDGVIKAGDTATFIYSTRYHLISIDRDETFNGDYNSLSNKPTIPSLNGYATEEFVKNEIAKIDTTVNIVDSEEDMVDTSKQYVHSGTNTWWKYKQNKIPAGSVLANVNNAINWASTEVVLNKRLNSSFKEVDAPGCAIFYFTFDNKMQNILKTVDPVWIRMKGCSCYATQGNQSSTKVSGFDSTGKGILTVSPHSQVIMYEETKNGISSTPYSDSTFPYNDNKTAPVTAIKFCYSNATVNDNSTNTRFESFTSVAEGKFAMSLIVNFASTTAITEDDLKDVYITFNEPIASYEEITIADWFDTGIVYNAGDDSSVVDLGLRVSELEDKVEELENRPVGGGSTSTTSTLPSYWKRRLDVIGEKIETLQMENGMDTLQFLWCSDIHGVPGTYPSNTEYIGAIGRYMMDKYNIPFFMVSGDIMSQGSHPSTDKIWNEYSRLIPMLSPIKNEEFLAIKGNHDGAYGSPMEYNGQANQYYHSYIGDNELFNAFMRRQTLDSHRRVFGKNGMYYYIDYHNYRVYMLNSHTFGDCGTNASGQALYNGFKHSVFGSEQLQWIADTLMSVKENQQVIFVAHAPITYMKDADVFANMLVYYRQRKSYTASADVSDTYWASGTEYSTSTVTKDFAAAKGDFVGYFNGHIHSDTMSMLGHVPMFSITCAGGDVRDQYYTNGTLARRFNTPTETAIDLVTITSEYVYCTRLGCGYDRKFNRLTQEITIDYDSAYIPPEEPDIPLTQGEITSEVTWRENTRLSGSSGGYSDQTNTASSSDIKVVKGDVIRIYHDIWDYGYHYVIAYSDTGAMLYSYEVSPDEYTGTHFNVSVTNNWILAVTITSDDVDFIRVCKYCTDASAIRVSRNAELDIIQPSEPINYFDTNGEGYVAWDGSKMYTNYIPYRCAEAGSKLSPVYHLRTATGVNPYKFRIIYPDKTTMTALSYTDNANSIGGDHADYDYNVRLVQHDFIDSYGTGDWYIQFEYREDCASSLIIQIDKQIKSN